MNRPGSALVAAVVLLAAAPALAQEAAPAGRVKVVQGSAFVVRAGVESPVVVGQPVFATDALKTGADGHLGVTLGDETRVSLGPMSEVRLERFLYAPAQGRFGLALSFLRGVAGYVSGRIAKLAPDAVRLETPSAIVGVRGTTLAIRVAG